MLNKLKALLAPDDNETEDAPADQLQLAAAVLMVEAAWMDGDFSDDERTTVTALLKDHFALSDDDATALVELAETEQEESGHLHRYTSEIKDRFDEQQRLEIIELLWEVVYADGRLHAYEANLLRRVAGLIYVSDRDRGEARKRVLSRLGIQE